MKRANQRGHRVLAQGGLVGLLVAGCNTSGAGTLRGVHYEVALDGSYTLHVHYDREQVWIPSDDDRPFVAIGVFPRPIEGLTGKPLPCDPREADSEGGAIGAFIFVRAGDSAQLQAFDPPRGVTLSATRCIPPGDETLSCVASFNDGEMSPERKEIARRVCKSLALR